MDLDLDLVVGERLTAIDAVVGENSITVGILACGRDLQSAEPLGDYCVAIPIEWQNKLLHQVHVNTELRRIGRGEV
jgi:hypothetical protein